jgi:hypothetical protein
MKLIVDRIEGSFAICEAEDMKMVDIPLKDLPASIKEGDRLAVTDGVYEIVAVDQDRKKRLKSLMDELWEG